MENQPKYIFVTGGVTSSLGKGIVAASLGLLLKSRGLRVTLQKFDPYINVDPGTLNPYEHGECYVTEDGAETDLDLGHYERFLNQPTTQANNVTTGRIYQSVIEKERRGDYLGKTVQIVPHITNEIKRRIKMLGRTGNYDIIITEIGGTVGDIESLPFIEAVRQLRWDLGRENSLFIHLTLIPYLAASGELKTKPSQHSVRLLMESGIQADILVCRTEHELSRDLRNKLALFCNVALENVIECLDVKTIYDVPMMLLEQNFDDVVLKGLNMPVEGERDLTAWMSFLERFKKPVHQITIGLVGKYVSLQDSYKSITEALIHAGAFKETRINIQWIYSGDLTEENIAEAFENCDGILIAPGFGDRGVEGKILAAKYCREQNIPLLGICLGMQMMAIEFARNVLGYTDAESSEMNSQTPNPVISLMADQKNVTHKGGTMRLGNWKCQLQEGSMIREIYDQEIIEERHRHRYEFNNEYLDDFDRATFHPVGINPETGLVEILEYKNHPFYLGVQFHPEYRSTVIEPHPLFIAFITAASQNQSSK
ncbi:MAG: CTP synthase [Weeksellaceae bacterium]|nr:CTP synthase [Weeksellaceae bacterium]